MNEKTDKKLTWQDVVVTLSGMAAVLTVICIAAFVFRYNGKVLIGGAILLVGLANTDVLKLLLPYVSKAVQKK